MDPAAKVGRLELFYGLSLPRSACRRRGPGLWTLRSRTRAAGNLPSIFSLLFLLGCLVAWLLHPPLGHRFPEPQICIVCVGVVVNDLRPQMHRDPSRKKNKKASNEFCVVGELASFGKAKEGCKKAESSALTDS